MLLYLLHLVIPSLLFLAVVILWTWGFYRIYAYHKNLIYYPPEDFRSYLLSLCCQSPTVTVQLRCLRGGRDSAKVIARKQISFGVSHSEDTSEEIPEDLTVFVVKCDIEPGDYTSKAYLEEHKQILVNEAAPQLRKDDQLDFTVSYSVGEVHNNSMICSSIPWYLRKFYQCVAVILFLDPLNFIATSQERTVHVLKKKWFVSRNALSGIATGVNPAEKSKEPVDWDSVKISVGQNNDANGEVAANCV